MITKLSIIILIGTLVSIECLDNGLALTPPMGWMSWERFRCIIDCVNYPNECISEALIKATADRMAEDGYLEAGYNYIIIDDCWLATERDSEGRLQPNAERFPSGIKALADYIHSRGLKFGIYEDIGTLTCGGYPGIDNNLELDSNTFAEWGVDYIKVDGCYQDTDGMEEKYAEFGAYLNATGRPIVYSCSFPAYKYLETNYTAAVELCNLWRNYDDIQDTWTDIIDISNWFATYQAYLTQFSGPGHWNDPDMLIIGNYGLSYDQSISQMTIWTLLAAPLLMSVDLRTIEPEFRNILLNKGALRINQDALGIPGILAKRDNNINYWMKPILPIVENKYSYGFGIVNFREGGGPSPITFTLETFGLDNASGYTITNIFESTAPVNISAIEEIQVFVNPTGAILFQLNPIPNGS